MRYYPCQFYQTQKLKSKNKNKNKKLQLKIYFSEKISIFENNVEKDTIIENKFGNLYLKDNIHISIKEKSTPSVSSTDGTHNDTYCETDSKLTQKEALDKDEEKSQANIPDKVYKSNLNKFNFLQTQLSGDVTVPDNDLDDTDVVIAKKKEDCNDIINEKPNSKDEDSSTNVLKEESNVTDDIRIAKRNSITLGADALPEETNECNTPEEEVKIVVPPRKKKHIKSSEKTLESVANKAVTNKVNAEEYPDYLNPFSDEEEVRSSSLLSATSIRNRQK